LTELREVIGMATVDQLTELQQTAHREQYSEAEVKEWVVMDGKLVYEFYDTLEEAQRGADELNFDDKLADEFGEWVDTITAKYPNAELEHVYEVIAGRCHTV